METDNKRKFLINIAYYGVICGIIYLFFRYCWQYALPFALGLIVAYIASRPVDWLCRKTGWTKTVCSVLLLTLTILVIIGILALFGTRIVLGVVQYARRLPTLYDSSVAPALETMLSWYETFDFEAELGQTFGAIMSSAADSILTKVETYVTDFSVTVVKAFTSFLSSLPSFLVTFLITIVAAYFISFDYDKVTKFIRAQLPEKVNTFITHFRKGFVSTIFKYVYSYAIILFVTFVELSIVMFIAGVENPVGFGLGIAIFDIMPIVGVSTVIIPWAIYCVIIGNYKRAIILVLGNMVMYVVRQFMEPRVVGAKVGLHPVISLICCYVGLKLGGILGMFGLPISLVVLNEMQKSGLIKFYNEIND